MKTNESTKVHQTVSLLTAVESGKYWSINEIHDLRDLKAANTSNFEIAQLLGRSLYAVSSKFNVIGLDGDVNVLVGARSNKTPNDYGVACASCFCYHGGVC